MGSLLLLARLAKWRLLSCLLLLSLISALALGPALFTLGPRTEVALALERLLSSQLPSLIFGPRPEKARLLGLGRAQSAGAPDRG